MRANSSSQPFSSLWLVSCLPESGVTIFVGLVDRLSGRDLPTRCPSLYGIGGERANPGSGFAKTRVLVYWKPDLSRLVRRLPLSQCSWMQREPRQLGIDSLVYSARRGEQLHQG
jgi:hypothetical protein